MTETPEQQMTRLQHEVDQAKIDELNRELAAAKAGGTVFPAFATVLPPEVRARLTPQVQQLIANFQQRGFGVLGPSLAPSLTTPPGPPVADGPPLAPGPRKVPWQFRAVLFPWSWWTLLALVMITVAPGIVWIGVPLAGAAVSALTFLIIVGLRLRREHRQLTLLKWGDVARVVNAETVSVGTCYSGLPYQNVRLPQAHGWQVKRQWYSGPSTSTKLTYEVGGKQATIGLHGLPYDNGVILADPRKPERALCVSSFAYDLDRDSSGNWVGKLPGRVVVGSIAMTVLLLAWTAAMVANGIVMTLDIHGLVRSFNWRPRPEARSPLRLVRLALCPLPSPSP